MKFIDSPTYNVPSLVMEYVRLGSLTQEIERDSFAIEDCVPLLCQGLDALRHIHSQDCVHRDIKPDNILVESRSPLHIKLGDFGLLRPAHNRITFVGTSHYLAPETWNNDPKRHKRPVPITTAVDVWALGVVVLETAYQNVSHTNPINDCVQQVVDTVNDLDTNPLSDLLATKMLIIDPQRRLSAVACLQEAESISLEALQSQVMTYSGSTLKDSQATILPSSEVGEDTLTIRHDSSTSNTVVMPKPTGSPTLTIKRRRLIDEGRAEDAGSKSVCSDGTAS